MALRIGIVDLCTSHPKKFIPILREHGCEITAVWDSGQTRPAGFAEEFAAEHEIADVCEEPEQMIERVDAVTIHTADWDRHIDLAWPFIEAGKAVCLDKPMVGTVSDLDRLMDLDKRHPGLIFGGSSCPFANEIVSLGHQLIDAGPIISALATGPNDLFSYGIHTVAMALSVVGYEVQSVQCLRSQPLGNYLLRLPHGADLHLHMHMPSHTWFMVVNTAEQGPICSTIDPAGLYLPFVERFLEFAQGQTEDWSLAQSLEPVRVAIAMRRAAITGESVDPNRLDAEDGFDGQAFAQAYREARDRGANLYLEQKHQRWADLYDPARP